MRTLAIISKRAVEAGRPMLAIALATSVVATAGLSGCRRQYSEKPPRQVFPDMDDSPKWEPQGESDFFADGRTMRQPAAGTVAFARHAETYHIINDPSERDDLLKEDDNLYRGRDADGDFINTIPASVEVTRAFIERGRDRFDIYCGACHGYRGEGSAPLHPDHKPSGMVGVRWSYPVPSFHDPKYSDKAQRTGKDGYMFDVIRRGKWDEQLDHSGTQKMPSYAHALSERDTWAVVAYVRTLQRSWMSADNLDDASLPAGTRPQPNPDPAAPTEEMASTTESGE